MARENFDERKEIFELACDILQGEEYSDKIPKDLKEYNWEMLENVISIISAQEWVALELPLELIAISRGSFDTAKNLYTTQIFKNFINAIYFCSDIEAIMMLNLSAIDSPTESKRILRELHKRKYHTEKLMLLILDILMDDCLSEPSDRDIGILFGAYAHFKIEELIWATKHIRELAREIEKWVPDKPLVFCFWMMHQYKVYKTKEYFKPKEVELFKPIISHMRDFIDKNYSDGSIKK